MTVRTFGPSECSSLPTAKPVDYQPRCRVDYTNYEDVPLAINLSDDAILLLEDVAEHPFVELTDRYDRLLNRYRGNKAKNELVEEEYVEEHRVEIQPVKRMLLEPTEKGRIYFASEDIAMAVRGRGSIVHTFWQHRIKETFEPKAAFTKVERLDADVYVEISGLRLAIEVARSNRKREIEHVEKHLDNDFDGVVVACQNEHVRQALKRRLAENELLTDDVQLRLLRFFA